MHKYYVLNRNFITLGVEYVCVCSGLCMWICMHGRLQAPHMYRLVHHVTRFLAKEKSPFSQNFFQNIPSGWVGQPSRLLTDIKQPPPHPRGFVVPPPLLIKKRKSYICVIGNLQPIWPPYVWLQPLSFNWGHVFVFGRIWVFCTYLFVYFFPPSCYISSLLNQSMAPLESQQMHLYLMARDAEQTEPAYKMESCL